MTSLGPVRLLFVFSALYDALIGAAFALMPGALYEKFSVPPPNHWAYVRFPGLLLVIFGLMFLAVAWRPVANRNLIAYGMLLKLAYGGTVMYYWFTASVPNLWKPFAVADVLFLLAFAWAYVRIGRAAVVTQTVVTT